MQLLLHCSSFAPGGRRREPAARLRHAASAQRMGELMQRDARDERRSALLPRELWADEHCGELGPRDARGDRGVRYECDRGGLGLKFTRSAKDSDDGARAGQAGWVVITEVLAEGPADRAGMRRRALCTPRARAAKCGLTRRACCAWGASQAFVQEIYCSRSALPMWPRSRWLRRMVCSVLCPLCCQHVTRLDCTSSMNVLMRVEARTLPAHHQHTRTSYARARH